MKTVLKRIAIAAAVAGAVSVASATPIIGIANLSFGQVNITFGNVDWNPPINNPPNFVKTYGGFFTAGGANTGLFAGPAFAGVTVGSVQDMSSFPDANFIPIGPGLTPKFISFAAKPGWIFDAYNLAPGSPIPGSPYVLTETGGNVAATITLSGLACDDGGGNANGVCDVGDDITKWTGIFSAQYTNATIASLAAILGGCVPFPLNVLGPLVCPALPNNTWSGTFEATALPEPGSMALLGLGLVGLAATRRRSAKTVK